MKNIQAPDFIRKPKSNATRKAQERQRKREAGLRPIEVWIPAKLSTAEVQKHVAKLWSQE